MTLAYTIVMEALNNGHVGTSYLVQGVLYSEVNGCPSEVVLYSNNPPSVCSELTGVNCAEWNSLFNGQLDDVSSPGPMTGVQSQIQPDTTMLPTNSPSTDQPPHIDR